MLHKIKVIAVYYYFVFCAIWLETLLKKIEISTVVELISRST